MNLPVPGRTVPIALVISVLLVATACTSPTNPNKQDEKDTGAEGPTRTGMIVPSLERPQQDLVRLPTEYENPSV